MQAEGRVGIQQLANGAQAVERLTRDGGVVVGFGHSYYYEPAYQGKIMEAANAVAGVAPGAALSTTPPMSIWNPPNSGVNLSLIKVAMGYVSGTLPAGCIAYAFVPGQTSVPTTGTELTPNCTLLGNARGAGRAFTGSTLIAAPTLLRAAFNIGPMLATSVYQPSIAADVLDGAIVVPQGTVFVVQGIAVGGSTPLVIFSVAWEEIAA